MSDLHYRQVLLVPGNHDNGFDVEKHIEVWMNRFGMPLMGVPIINMQIRFVIGQSLRID
mgnify:FL=1